MGTTLAVMIGLLAPTADPSLSTNYQVYGDTRVMTAGFASPTADQYTPWAHGAERQFSLLSAYYAPQGGPPPPRPDILGVERQYHDPSCGCSVCAAGASDCCDLGCYRCCRGRLPNPWCARCDLPQHHPYVAEPKTYYYFRAYTHIHTPAIQEEAKRHGGSRGNPYDTKLFAGVYEEVAKSIKASARQGEK